MVHGGLEALGFPFAAGLILLAVSLLFKAALVPSTGGLPTPTRAPRRR